MQGNVVTAARWLGASMILASGILVGGLHWVLSVQSDRLAESIRVLTAPANPVGPVSVLDHPRDPARRVDTVSVPARVEQLLEQSERLRTTGDEWERFWLQDQPSQMKPFHSQDLEGTVRVEAAPAEPELPSPGHR